MQKNKWTQEEKNMLKELYPTCTTDELQILLVRFSKKQIRNQATKLQLKKDDRLRKFIHAENGKKHIHTMYTDKAKEKKKASIREMVRKERLRLKYGLPQKTKRFFSAVTRKESAKNAKRGYNLKKRGYYLDYNNKILYYWAEITKRTERTERFYKKIGYKIINNPTEVINHLKTAIKPLSITIREIRKRN